jgi:RecJ-like exonuclease
LVTIKGIVSAIKLSPNPAENVYAILSEQQLSVRCDSVLELGDMVEISVDAISDGHLKVGDFSITGKATKSEYEKALKGALSVARISSKVEKSRLHAMTAWMPGQLAKATVSMSKEMGKGIVLLGRAFISGAPIIIRFHNDCDGSSGAIGLYKALEGVSSGTPGGNLRWQMNRSVVYLQEAAESDLLVFNGYVSMEKPLVVIMDFGTTEESVPAIGYLSGKCNFIWLDHHPPPDKFPRESITNYINPWDHGGDSDYTAGFLGCVFAQLLHDMDLKELQLASLIGDFSKYADTKHERAQKVAVVLDFVTSSSTRTINAYRIEKLTPRYMDSLLNDKERFESFYRYAANTMDDALEAGMRTAKHYKTKAMFGAEELPVNIYIMDFKHIMNESGYPLPGRYSSKLQSKLELLSDGETMTVVHYGNYISIRMTKRLAETYPIQGIVEKLKALSEYVKSGGGHAAAGGIKIEEQHAKSVIKLLLREFGIKESQ